MVLKKITDLSNAVVPLEKPGTQIYMGKRRKVRKLSPAVATASTVKKLDDPFDDSDIYEHLPKMEPMAIEQVLSDKDSEDEVDDDVADFEDRRMLENFVDVSKDEKNFMHMWNSFVRKHRVIADGHISWACEAFSKLHAPEFDRSRSLAGCWRIFMVKLYNHGLLDARTMNDCNIILEQYHMQNSDPQS